ncbi:hypothetical protein SBDP1_910016 [Syntrophobacter sp. SbD1]|nr:hypothetical protein SBDP1_910016 [Syntrophobacter sp. SbD1]
MKKYIRNYYEQLHQGKKGSKVSGVINGKSLAVEFGYPDGLIDRLPDEIWEEFLPCGNVLPYLHTKPGDRVLNLGCGSGVDSIVLRLRTGGELTIVNLDAAISALIKLRDLAKRFSPGPGFDYLCADGDCLPFRPDSFEWVILNGVFNLFPEKGQLIAELYRVLKPGGVVAGADLCRNRILPGYFASEPDAWAWCMSGALSRDELSKGFETGGFTKLAMVLENMDEYFDRTVFAFQKSFFRQD